MSGTPRAHRARIAIMPTFAAQHAIRPLVEIFPMAKVNEALAHLEAGKARYRIVLEA